MEPIPKDQLVEGCLYFVNCRNFNLGIWDGDGFVGVREKFDYTYLTKETGPAFRLLGPLSDLKLLQTFAETSPFIANTTFPDSEYRW